MCLFHETTPFLGSHIKYTLETSGATSREPSDFIQKGSCVKIYKEN